MRPFGSVVDLSAYAAQTREALEAARAAAATSSYQLHEQQRVVNELERQIAHLEATGHARPVDIARVRELQELATTMRGRLRDVQGVSRAHSRTYTATAERWDALRAESRTRRALTPDQRAAEDRARIVEAGKIEQRRAAAAVTTSPSAPSTRGPRLR